MNTSRLRSLLQAATIALLLACTSINVFGADKLAKPPAESVQAINPTELRMHLEFLTSDALGGRYTLSPNFGIVAEYLASRLRAYGFKGAGPNGSFFQPFEVVTVKADGDKSFLTLTINGETTEHPYGDFYNAGSTAGTVEAPLVFAGYGISAPRLNHDDYAGLDAKGKIVLIASGDPKGIDPSKVAEEEEDQSAARAHGAIAVIRIPSPRYAEAMKSPEFKDRSLQVESVKLAEKNDNDAKLPVARLSPTLADKLLAPLGFTLEKFNELVKKGEQLTPKSLEARARLTVALSENKVETQNVVATLEGTDPQLKDEYVAFSAHYDHLKTGKNGEIYHGADDDGSGTASVLNIARALALQRPKRSVFIIFHAGEELGLLGSKFNTDYSPAVPLDKLQVDLNIDMIGRSKPAGDTDKADEQLTDANTIYVVGSDRISHELDEISVKTDADFEKMKFDYLLNNPSHPERIYFRSDHWNYAKHGVPIIFYFDGIHVDYHKPTDTIDKIDFTKMTRVARLVFETGWRIANLDHRLKRDAAVAAK